MKSALSGFLVTALLLALHVAPSAEQLQGYASPADRAFAERHANEFGSGPARRARPAAALGSTVAPVSAPILDFRSGAQGHADWHFSHAEPG